MIDFIDQFKSRVLGLHLGETYRYYRGQLASGRGHQPSIDKIATLAHGLQLLEAAVLTQRRLGVDDYEYLLRVTRPIRNADFDKARVASIHSSRTEAS